MRLSRRLRWISLLQHGFFVLCFTLPAYLAASQVLASSGVGLVWYHRVMLAAVCLLFVAAVMVLFGFTLILLYRLAKLIRGRSGRRV